jgi:uncharacterized protein
MDDLFAPPEQAWQRVSPQLRQLHRSVVVVAAALGGVLLSVLASRWLPAVVVISAVFLLALVAGVAGWVLAGRRQRSWGYAERGEDLFITSGVMFRRLTAVPYGRMQFVDVTAGPLERAFGIATVTLHTATPATSARIPGLPPAEAARLRDRLTQLGEARAAGL